MTDIVFVFEVHQPHRLRRNLFWENKIFKRLKKEELFNYYFDNEVDKEIFKRAAKKCYFPSNQILLDAISQFRKEKKQVKVSFSVSGVFLEQCEMFDKDLAGDVQATCRNWLRRIPKPNVLSFNFQPLSRERRIYRTSKAASTNS